MADFFLGRLFFSDFFYSVYAVSLSGWFWVWRWYLFLFFVDRDVKQLLLDLKSFLHIAVVCSFVMCVTSLSAVISGMCVKALMRTRS